MASIFSNKKTQNKNQQTNTIKDNRSILNEYNPNQNTFTQAISNIDESSKQLVNDIITPFLNPMQTAKDLYSLSKSVASLIPGIEGDDTQAKAVGKFFKDRYGSLENIKQTFATDPVGMLSDVSILLTGGATLTAKAPQVSSVLSKASKIASPIETAGGFAIGKAAQGSGTLVNKFQDI